MFLYDWNHVVFFLIFLYIVNNYSADRIVADTVKFSVRDDYRAWKESPVSVWVVSGKAVKLYAFQNFLL